MKIKIHIPLSMAGRQAVSAGVMLALGLAVIVGTKDYTPRTFETGPLPATPSDASVKDLLSDPDPDEMERGKPGSVDLASSSDAKLEESSSARLNMAYIYPDGADTGDAWNSYAGQASQLMSELDSRWISRMYEMMKSSPEEMTGKLEISRNGILGLYNPSVVTQNQEDPDSWVIPDWSNSQVVFHDGDGNVIDGYSNGKEIVAAVSVYAFYHEEIDGEAFVDICKKLWEATHQDTAQMSEVYYCDGSCQMEQDAVEAASGTGAGETQTAAGTGAGETQTTAGTGAGETRPTAATAAEDTKTAAGVNQSAVLVSEAETLESSTLPEVSAGTETTESEFSLPSETPDLSAGSADAAEIASITNESSTETSESVDYNEIRKRYSLEEVPADWESYEGPAREVWEEVIAAYQEETSPAGADQLTTQEQEVTCPGHIDLQINAVIMGMTENRNLFEAFPGDAFVGAADMDGKATGSWQGWTDENRQYALTLQDQDWETAYGLPFIQTLYMGTPLSPDEIAYYMDMLPEDVTVFQRELIRQALQSVGGIPYYWGGKAASAGFEGNNFGAVTAPDTEGRRLRGLDCSGWINWVYWTALGTRLQFESTHGLAQLGTAIERSQLQPGDIIVRTGTETPHVYLFLAWAPDGEMYVIHETSGNINNVTVSRLNAEGPHYRRLLHNE